VSLYDRVLITGGGGMLAYALIRALRIRGVEPIVLGRADLDISNAKLVKEVIGRHEPNLILNCAAYTKVDLCESEIDLATNVNAGGAHAVADAAWMVRAKLVHYSTDFVFDGQKGTPYRPDDPVNPLSMYGKTKRFGEVLMRTNALLDYLIIRTAWLYGPNGPCFPQTMINAAKAGKPLKVVSDQTGTPTFTFDLAEATLDLLDRNAKGIWHITNSGATTWYDFTAAILEEFNLKTDLSPTTSAEWKKLKPNSATRPAYSVLDVSPYEKLVGKPMPDWRDALHRYHLALKQN
jgi:dTDP-4-dehydrorhamnose reductase